MLHRVEQKRTKTMSPRLFGAGQQFETVMIAYARPEILRLATPWRGNMTSVEYLVI